MAANFSIFSVTNGSLCEASVSGRHIKSFFKPDQITKLFFIMTFVFFLNGFITCCDAQAASVTLSWERNQEPDIAGYKIYYGTASRSYQNSITVNDRANQPLMTSYTVTGLKDGVTYYFAIRAFDLAGQLSDFSDEVAIKTGNNGGGGGGTITPGWYKDESWIEVGSVLLDHQWKKINLTKTFQNPVVIVGPPTFNGPQPCIIRLKNVGSRSFEMRIQEWMYLDGWHMSETVPYMVIEAGVHHLPDGTMWEAGKFNLSGTFNWKKVVYPSPFAAAPLVFQTMQTFNGAQTVILREKNVTADHFYSAMQEEEKLDDGHVTETIGYLAVEKKSLASLWANEISCNHNFASVSSIGKQVKLEEETSRDNEIAHITEKLGILNLDGKIFTQIQSFIGADPVEVRIR